MPVVRRQHKIDYLGAATIVGAVTCLLLYLDWRGTQYGWTELWAMACSAAPPPGALFVWIERRAVEPIIPMRLFRIQVFSVGNAFAFLAGIVMFGTIIFLPVYLQAVMGMSRPSRAWPCCRRSGIFSTSITSGQLISRTGRYKIYPVLGAVIMTVALLTLSRLGVDTPFWQVAVYTYLFGAGLGFTMQTIVTAVQNSVERRDMGAATSSITFFRQMGGSVGAALFGAVLSSRLAHYLAEQLAGRASGRAPAGPGRGQQRPGHPAARRAGQERGPARLHQRPGRRVPGRGAVRGRGHRGRAAAEGGAAAHRPAVTSG